MTQMNGSIGIRQGTGQKNAAIGIFHVWYVTFDLARQARMIYSIPMSTIEILNPSQIWERIQQKNNAFQAGYYAFYSSWYGGIVKDPHFLMCPLDDHMVHRGDAVFEAIKTVGRQVFLMDPHIDRLFVSAEKIGLKPRWSKAEIKDIILQTLKAADQSETLIRLFLSRGPGGFTTNPYDPAGTELYIVITELKLLPAAKYQAGVHIGRSEIPVKETWMAQVKSCNYLPNVMMKKEAVDRKLDFTVSFDRDGFLTESSTENIVIVDTDGVITQPELRNILKGTTMTRALDIAQASGKKIAHRNLTEKDLISAKEVMMIGTTLDVLPVTKYENQIIADGKVGPLSIWLKSQIEADFKKGLAF